MVDALVGALGRQHDGHEQFEGVAVVQLRFGVVHDAAEVLQHVAEEFFFPHIYIMDSQGQCMNKRILSQ